MVTNSLIQVRRGLSSEWSSTNPVLSFGEPGLETDTNKVKYGDGVNPWLDLPYSDGTLNISDVTGLQDGLDGKLAVSGGTMEGQILFDTGGGDFVRSGYTIGPYTVADGNWDGGVNQEIYISISDAPTLGSMVEPGDFLGDGADLSSTTPIVSVTNDGEYFTVVAARSWLNSNPQTVMFSRPSKTWTFGTEGNLNIPGNILLNNGTSVAIGTYDSGYAGSKGISLNCAVGYELNWQAGRLKSTYNNGEFTSSIYIDSPITYSPTVALLNYSSNLTIDAKLGEVFDITLEGNITLDNPVNPTNGKTIRYRVTQDSTGSRTVTLGNKFNIPSSATSPLPWSTAPNKMDVLAVTYHEGRDKWDVIAFVPGY